MTKLTSKEAMTLLGLPNRQVLSQWRNGYTSKGYTYPPKLEKDKHWFWEDGKVLFNKEELEKFIELNKD